MRVTARPHTGGTVTARASSGSAGGLDGKQAGRWIEGGVRGRRTSGLACWLSLPSPSRSDETKSSCGPTDDPRDGTARGQQRLFRAARRRARGRRMASRGAWLAHLHARDILVRQVASQQHQRQPAPRTRAAASLRARDARGWSPPPRATRRPPPPSRANPRQPRPATVIPCQ